MKLKEFNEELKNQAQFNIPNRSEQISVVDFLQDFQPRRKVYLPRLLVSAASLLLLLGLSFYVYLRFTPVTTLTVDFNPSLVVELNSFNRVVSISASNQDAEPFIADLRVNNQKLSKLMEQIKTKALEEGYVSNTEAYALIGVYGEDLAEEEAIVDILENDNYFTYLAFVQYINPSNNESYIESNINLATDQSTDVSSSPETPGSGDEYNTPIAGDAVDSINDSRAFSEEFLSSSLEDIADQFNISLTKLNVVIAVFNYYDTYSTYDDFVGLTNADITTLIALYNSIQ